MTQYLTLQLMRQMWPHGDSKVPGLLEGIVATAPAVFAKYGFDSPLVVAHFMAQITHECGGGVEVIENLNYKSPQRIAQVWPRRFTSVTAIPYVNNPQKLANKVYNGRMGNIPGSNDGWNFRGRGASQTTGREGYERLAAKTGLDVIGNPDLLISPKYFLELAAADYVLCGCLPYAKRDDIRGETQKLNGGQTNINDRIEWLNRWKVALRKAPLAVAQRDEPLVDDDNFVDDAPNTGTALVTTDLQYGSAGYEVTALQGRLNELGYHVGTTDEDFGPQTRAAVLAFQADNNLPTTGIVDEATKEALKSDATRPLAQDRVDATAADLRAAGSETIKTQDKVGLVGKIAAFLGISGAADKTGGLQKVTDTVEQVQTLQPVVETFKGILTWAGGHWWLWVAVAGFAIYYWAHQTIDRRVLDHATGANIGR